GEEAPAGVGLLDGRSALEVDVDAPSNPRARAPDVAGRLLEGGDPNAVVRLLTALHVLMRRAHEHAAAYLADVVVPEDDLGGVVIPCIRPGLAHRRERNRVIRDLAVDEPLVQLRVADLEQP